MSNIKKSEELAKSVWINAVAFGMPKGADRDLLAVNDEPNFEVVDKQKYNRLVVACKDALDNGFVVTGDNIKDVAYGCTHIIGSEKIGDAFDEILNNLAI